MTIAEHLRAKGIQEGRQEGRQEKELEIVRQLIADGVERKLVERYTNLTSLEIDSLIKQ